MVIHKVLMVDDEPDILQIGQMSLRAIGKWNVLVASSGEEGLALALQEKPDVVVLDVMMPGMDGPTLLARLREHPQTASTPVILLTANALRPEIEHFRTLGALGVITKPFDPMTLPAEIQSLVDGQT